MVAQAILAAIPNHRPRATLLEHLAGAKAEKPDREKIVTLSHQFLRVADYRHRVLHDEMIWHSPQTETVGLGRAERIFKGQAATEISKDWFDYMGKLAINVMARMQQFRINSEVWRNDEHFPWHGKPPQEPEKTTPQPRKRE
jgi:hypothetical protein